MEEPAEEAPKPKRGGLPGLPKGLAGFKPPKIKLPKVNLPTVDVGVLAGGMAIAFLSAGASVLAVHVFLPEREVQVIRNPRQVTVGGSFNRTGFPGFTVGPDVPNDFVSNLSAPQIDNSAYIHPQAVVLGSVQIGPKVLVAPQASIRGDVGQNLYIGASSAVLDGAVVRGRPTEYRALYLDHNQVRVAGQRYSVYLGDRVTVSAQAQIYGPAIVGDDTYVGEQSLVDHALVGKDCVLEPRSAVIGVVVGDGRYVPAGDVVRAQTAADILPMVTGIYPYHDADANAVLADTALAAGYNALYPRAVPTPGF